MTPSWFYIVGGDDGDFRLCHTDELLNDKLESVTQGAFDAAEHLCSIEDSHD